MKCHFLVFSATDLVWCFDCMHRKTEKQRNGEMPQWLRVLAALVGDPSSVLSTGTHMAAHLYP